MKTTTRLSLVILAFSAITTSAFAQAGTLDPDFATAGIGFYQPGNSEDRAADIIAMADNSLLVCGYSYQGTATSAFVAHILQDGTLDTSFGETNGYTFFPLWDESYAEAIVLGPDQSIYVAGSAVQHNFQWTTLLAHLSPSGIRDADFGTNGEVYTAISTVAAHAFDLALQPDGNIVLVGYADVDGSIFNNSSLFLRYLPDGTLDPTFNGTGIVLVDGSPFSDESMFCVALMDDGSIIGAGSGTNGGAVHDLMIKLDPNGTTSNSFGNAGILSTAVNKRIWDILINDGSIYAVGITDATSGHADAYLSKFHADGTYDIAFGTGGSTVSDFNVYDELLGIAVQPDGRILACGLTGDYASDEFSMLTVRYGTSGSMDPTFGDSGKSITHAGDYFQEANAVTIQPDGKIALAGVAYRTTHDVIVLRYLGDGTIGITDNESSGGQFSIFPNPVAGTSTTLQLPDANGAEVWVTDLQGRMIGSRTNVPKGMISVVLPTSDLANGNYFISVHSQGITTTLKMQVVK